VVLLFIALYRGCGKVEKKREDISFESSKLEYTLLGSAAKLRDTVEQDRGTRVLDLQVDGGHRGPSFEAENLNRRIGVVDRINAELITMA
jgi:hypothetical protein